MRKTGGADTWPKKQGLSLVKTYSSGLVWREGPEAAVNRSHGCYGGPRHPLSVEARICRRGPVLSEK